MTFEYQVSHFCNTLKNMKEITVLERLSFANPWSRESLTAELANPLNLTSIISFQSLSGTKLVGYCLTRIISPEAELLRIAVAPEMRRQGAATVILNGLLQKLQISQPVGRIYLEVSEKNQPAITLYRKTGFTEINCRPNYYDNGTTGALIFAKTIAKT